MQSDALARLGDDFVLVVGDHVTPLSQGAATCRSHSILEFDGRFLSHNAAIFPCHAPVMDNFKVNMHPLEPCIRVITKAALG